MSDIQDCFDMLSGKDPDGIVTVTEVVDAIVDECGGSREYLTRKVREHLRALGRKGSVVPLRKRVALQSGGTTLVPGYKPKRGRG